MVGQQWDLIRRGGCFFGIKSVEIPFSSGEWPSDGGGIPFDGHMERERGRSAGLFVRLWGWKLCWWAQGNILNDFVSILMLLLIDVSIVVDTVWYNEWHGHMQFNFLHLNHIKTFDWVGTRSHRWDNRTKRKDIVDLLLLYWNLLWIYRCYAWKLSSSRWSSLLCKLCHLFQIWMTKNKC